MINNRWVKNQKETGQKIRLEAALHEVDVMLAGPLRIGPDLSDGFPDVSYCIVSIRTQLHLLEKELMRWVNLLDVDDLQTIDDFLGHILDVLAVLVGQKDGVDAGAQSPDQLLLDAADGHDSAAQGHFTGHG